MEPTSPSASVTSLPYNIARSMEQCIEALKAEEKQITAPPGSAIPWCNATWDSVLCWPAIPGNMSATLPCPPLKGLDPQKVVEKFCHSSGLWLGKDAQDFTNPAGWTNYIKCMLFDQEIIKIAQQIAKGARKLEFVGLGLSFVSLCICVFIFAYFRRLRVFRIQLHLQLMIAILMVVIIRLTLYIDLIFTDRMGKVQALNVGYTINTMKIVCESMYFLLEYFKTVAFAWMFLEGFYLHNTLVITVFNEEPKLYKYTFVGYGIPLIHTSIWLLVVRFRTGKLERCLGSYYLQPEFWILDGPRMLELVVNFFFICNVIRVLWLKVKESHNSTEMDRMKKSVKAALMLIPLLGIPNIMQTIPFTPSRYNITFFAIWTYCASFSYMFQGFMIAILYCFTNKEVINVLRSTWSRYRLRHTSTADLRRGSKAIGTFHTTAHIKNGVALANSEYANGSPTSMRANNQRLSVASNITLPTTKNTELEPLHSDTTQTTVHFAPAFDTTL